MPDPRVSADTRRAMEASPLPTPKDFGQWPGSPEPSPWKRPSDQMPTAHANMAMPITIHRFSRNIAASPTSDFDHSADSFYQLDPSRNSSWSRFPFSRSVVVA